MSEGSSERRSGLIGVVIVLAASALIALAI